MTSHEKGISRLRASGGDLRQMLAMGTTLLEENVDAVNALNVFPVPDGDTGTNMLLTMQSAMAEVARSSSEEFGQVAHAAAHGALMGARGNSGVILSQILRGIARASEDKESLDASGFAAALKEGANTAYRGIGRPVEGTILTVAREAADAAVVASGQGRSLSQVVRRAVEAAATSLEATPTLLATLREAGVVDAGGQGYLLLLEGAQLFLTGKRTPAPLSRVQKARSEDTSTTESKADYGYCTEVLIRGNGLDVEDIRGRMEAIGTSVLVVGEPDLIHVHVHTHQPGDVLNLAGSLGTLDRVKVENMQIQHSSYLANRSPQSVAIGGVGVVAVVAGEGIARLFRDLGACAIVPGGQTMNPSIEELVHAANSCGREKVILLPNNPNVILTAQQSQALVKVDLHVVPTRTICEGVAAMVAFNPDGDLAVTANAMKEATTAVRTIELTRAVRSTTVNGLEISQGQAIGMLDGVLVEAGAEAAEVALRAMERTGPADHEIVTIYWGQDASESEAADLAAAVTARWSHLQIDLVDGGQPHYPYLISVE